ncbi:MAG: helix-turn-helix domain-containing protein [Acidobacteriota bacterium]|nr:helix-turn-helix domain-containing protein [Acidobacteriota bacterium]
MAGRPSLLRQVWNQLEAGDRRALRGIVKQFRRKLGDDASKPTCIFNERQVGYRMAKPDKG